MPFAGPIAASPACDRCTFGPTSKEWEIAGCLTQGLPDKAIANQLGNTAGTIRHDADDLRQARVQGRTQAALLIKKIADDSVSG